MAEITREEVLHIAELARLELKSEEVDAMRHDLKTILAYVASLEEIDTQGTPITTYVTPLETPLRPDEPDAPLDPERALANAPRRRNSAFLVPKVLDDDEA